MFTPTRNLNPGAAAFKPDKYHAFGKYFGTKNELKQEISRIKGETGKDIFEVGNDSMNIKPVRRKPDVEGATKELRYRLKHGRITATGASSSAAEDYA